MTIIIINRRAYYIIIYSVVRLPGAFKPERFDRCQEFDDPNSARMYRVIHADHAHPKFSITNTR